VRFFAEKDGGAFIGFDLIIHKFMFGPLGLTRAEPKLNFVSAIFSEEGVYCCSDRDEHVLKRISFGFKDFLCCSNGVTNFIRPYLHQFSIDSHGLNGYGKPLKRPFYRYQSRLEAINNGRDIRQIN